MKLSAIIEPLVAAGVSGEVILDTIKAFEAQQTDALEKRRQSDRDRQAKRRSHVTSRDVTVTVSSRAGDGDNSSKKDISGKEEKKDIAPAALTPCQELEAVLDAEHARAVVDHRQRIRKPLTAYAARKLAKSFSKAPDANAAADLMIEKGWQSFEVEWLDNRTLPRPHSTASPRETVGSLSLQQLCEPRPPNDDPGNSGKRVDAIGSGRLEAGSSPARPFTVSGDTLGSFGPAGVFHSS